MSQEEQFVLLSFFFISRTEFSFRAALLCCLCFVCDMLWMLQICFHIVKKQYKTYGKEYANSDIHLKVSTLVSDCTIKAIAIFMKGVASYKIIIFHEKWKMKFEGMQGTYHVSMWYKLKELPYVTFSSTCKMWSRSCPSVMVKLLTLIPITTIPMEFYGGRNTSVIADNIRETHCAKCLWLGGVSLSLLAVITLSSLEQGLHCWIWKYSSAMGGGVVGKGLRLSFLFLLRTGVLCGLLPCRCCCQNYWNILSFFIFKVLWYWRSLSIILDVLTFFLLTLHSFYT